MEVSCSIVRAIIIRDKRSLNERIDFSYLKTILYKITRNIDDILQWVIHFVSSEDLLRAKFGSSIF